MVKSKNSKGSRKSKDVHKIVVQELRNFNALVKGHKKILEAIGGL